MVRRNNQSENISYSDDDGSDSNKLFSDQLRIKSRSQGSSPKISRKTSQPVLDSKSRKSMDLVHHLQADIAEKDEKIEYLEKRNKEMEVLQSWESSGNSSSKISMIGIYRGQVIYWVKDSVRVLF